MCDYEILKSQSCTMEQAHYKNVDWMVFLNFVGGHVHLNYVLDRIFWDKFSLLWKKIT
jgi:hypothetical protein